MQNFDLMLEPLRALLHQVGVFMPKLLLAAGVLLVGWLIAKAFRFSVVRALRALKFHVLTERDTVDLFGWLGHALVVLASLIVAFNSLDLTQVTDLLGKVLLFVPRLLVALLVVVFGSHFARLAGNAVHSYCRGAEIGEGGGAGPQHAVRRDGLRGAAGHRPP